MRAQWTTPERPEESVGIVLNDPRSALLGQSAQLVQLAADTGIVHGHNAACPLGHLSRHIGGVKVEGVGPNVGKHQASASKSERVRCRDEREARQNYLVHRFGLQQHRRQLERMGTRCGQQNPWGTQLVLEQFFAAPAEYPAAANLTRLDDRTCVLPLVTDYGNSIKRNLHPPEALPSCQPAPSPSTPVGRSNESEFEPDTRR